MADEQLVDPAEAEEEEFVGEELQVGPAPSEPDDGPEEDEGDYEGEGVEPTTEQFAPPPPQMIAPPPLFRGPVAPPPPVNVPRDPSEILRDIQFDHLSAGDQAEALRQAGGQAEHSIDRARRDVLQERELASRAVVYREWPEEYQGTTIKGRVRQFKAPFTLANIEDWVATYRGGGKYKIQFYRGDGRYLESKVLDVEGQPILPGVKEDLEAQAREQASQGGGDYEARAALERQLAEERFERRMAEERARSDAQMGSISHALASLAEAIKHKPQEPARPPVDFAALAASAGPLVIAYLQSQDAKAAEATKQAREDRKALIEQQNAAEKRMMTMLTTLQGKKEGLSDAIKAMGEVKKLTGGENSEAKAFNKILDTALPRLIDATTRIQLHKAGVADGKDDEEFGAKMIVDRVTDLATTFMASRSAEPVAPQPQALPAPAASHGQYGVPVQQAPPAPQPMRAGGPIVTPEQQAQMEAAQHAAAMGHAPQPAPPPPGVQTSAPQPAPPPQQTDVNYAVFDAALAYMQEGKIGSELAHQLMTEEEANHNTNGKGSPHLYLSPRVINFLCIAQPEQVMRMLNPQIAQFEQYRALLDPIGQQFFEDFCLYFSAPQEGDEEAVPDAAADAAAADDITGGIAPDAGGPQA